MENIKNELKIKAAISSSTLPSSIETFAWISFGLNLLASLILLLNTFKSTYVSTGLYEGKYVNTINPTYLWAGILGIFYSILILLIMLGISRIIKQNNYLINRG